MLKEMYERRMTEKKVVATVEKGEGPHRLIALS